VHRRFRKLLEGATGSSEHVIAVYVDIRGFSLFSQQVESVDTGSFIKKIYIKLIDEYFDGAKFFKSTGDGLLIIFPYVEASLETTANKVVATCLRLVDEFPRLCDGDPIINFATPSKIGIGIARGSACRLQNKGAILDYSGKTINSSAKLMDLARPLGVVFDQSFVGSILTAANSLHFKTENLYVRGVSEEVAIDISYTHTHTSILEANRHPLHKRKWAKNAVKKKLREITQQGPFFRHVLDKRPHNASDIKVVASYPAVRGGRRLPNVLTHHEFTHFSFQDEHHQLFVRMNYAKLAGYLGEQGVKPNWDIEITISYPEA
jgi:class 3 adenylate cyclase